MRILLSLVAIASFISCQTTNPKNRSEIKLVDGIVADTDIEEFSAIMMLYFNGSPCTGVHLGEGYIITAAHCSIITGYGETPQLRIEDFKQNTVVSLSARDYISTQPDTGETVSMTSGSRSFDIPVPDLLIIRPRSEVAIRKIAEYPRFLPSSALLQRAQADLFMAGYGRTDYQAGSGVDGQLRIGSAGISDVEEKQYVSFWKAQNGYAGGAPGDSGGPLFSIDGERFMLHGIASNIQRSRNAEGVTEKVWTSYTRLDAPYVSDWVATTTGIQQPDDPSIDDTPVDQPITPPDGEDDSQFVGVYQCRSPSEAAPYWDIKLDFNDSRFAKIEVNLYASATSEEVPYLRQWQTDEILSYGSLLVVPGRYRIRVLFHTESMTADLVSDGGRPEVTDLSCVRL